MDISGFFPNENSPDTTGNNFLKQILGGNLDINLIPGIRSSGVNGYETFYTITFSIINILTIVIFVAAVIMLLIAIYKRISSNGETKPIEVSNKSIRNIIMSIVTLLVIVGVGNIVCYALTGYTLVSAPTMFRSCGGQTASDFVKQSPPDPKSGGFVLKCGSGWYWE